MHPSCLDMQGGNSADESGYVPASLPLPPNVTYRITDADFQAYAAAVPLWNGSITPGVNFRFAGNTSLAVAHMTGLQKIVPQSLLEGIEIGNECDLYSGNGIRNASFTMADYVSQWDAYQHDLAIRAGVTYPRIQGATFCCHKASYDGGLPAYIEEYASGGVLSSISYHHYATDHCNGHVHQLWELLTQHAASWGAQAIWDLSAVTRGNRIPFYIGEGNSIACGGEYGISDTFAASLWSVDMLMYMATAGVTRFNFHGCAQGAYTAIAYNNTAADVPDVRPLFYGMWMATQLTAHHAVVYNTSGTNSNPGLISSWSTKDEQGVWRVVIIHKDYNATGPAAVTVALPAGVTLNGSAQLARLAPQNRDVTSRYGLDYSGLTFDGSTDGRPVGTFAPESVAPSADGSSYSFSVNPTSIVLLTLPTA